MSGTHSPAAHASGWLLSIGNVAMTAALGYGLGGLAGSLFAVGSVVLLLLGLQGFAWLRGALARRRSGETAWPVEVAIIGGKLLLAPFALALAIVVAVGTTLLGLLLSAARRSPAAAAAPEHPPARAAGPPRNWKENFADGGNVAFMIGNLILLLVIASIWIGIEVAYYAALLATPIWLLVLIMLAIEGVQPSPAPGADDHGGG